MIWCEIKYQRNKIFQGVEKGFYTITRAYIHLIRNEWQKLYFKLRSVNRVKKSIDVKNISRNL